MVTNTYYTEAPIHMRRRRVHAPPIQAYTENRVFSRSVREEVLPARDYTTPTHDLFSAHTLKSRRREKNRELAAHTSILLDNRANLPKHRELDTCPGTEVLTPVPIYIEEI